MKKFNRPFPKQDLDLDDLDRFLDCDSGKTVKNFLLNGNHGDPIYYPNLLHMIRRFRDRSFSISTNGSYQKENFWRELAEITTEQDTVFFSIDGLEQDNHLYRRNADWDSIMMGLDIMSKSRARVVWKTLIFEYNHDKIEDIQRFAESKGARFHVDITERFGDNDLRPRNPRYVDVTRLYDYSRNTTILEPRCDLLKYISSDGYFWPCCMITTVETLYNTELWQNKEKWSIKNQTMDQALVYLYAWKQKIQDNPTDAHAQCKMHCKPGQKYAWPTI